MSKKNKIIKLKPRSEKKSKLSATEQNELVLEFRVKARKLARSILRRWNSRLEVFEIDSLVDLSLCEASKRFDPDKGASFMTFLYYHLKGNLIKIVTKKATANSVPVDFVEAEDCDLYGHNYAYRSANSIEVTEALSLFEVERPDETLEKKELLGIAKKACSNLDELEREVIQRVILKGQQIVDVAKLLGYSRCHVSRIKTKAISQLRNDMEISLENPSTNVCEIRHKKISRRSKKSKKVAVEERQVA